MGLTSAQASGHDLMSDFSSTPYLAAPRQLEPVHEAHVHLPSW